MRDKLEKLLFIVFIGFFSIIYFHKIGCSSLESFDEAWYASIARNLAFSKNPLLMTYNGWNFTDHPPFAISLISLSGKIFDEFNSFSVRFPAFILGIGSLVLIYFISKKYLDSRVTGFLAMMMLGSSLWWILRVRSGNLDVTWIFFFLSTIYLTLEGTKKPWKFLLAGASTACLILSKTLIGFSIVPLLLFILFWKKVNLKEQWKFMFGGIAVFLLIVLPWYLYNFFTNSNFFNHHFLEIGLRINQTEVKTALDLPKNLLYLQSGVGSWYKILITGSIIVLPLIVFLIVYKKNKELLNLTFLLLWSLTLATPLLFSAKLQVWHLLPTYAPLILMSSYTLVVLIKIISKKINIDNSILLTILFLGTVFLGAKQIKNILPIIYPTSCSSSSEEKISRIAANYPQMRVNLKSWFLPAAVFYSEKEVGTFMYNKNAMEDMIKILNQKTNDVFIINEQDLIYLDENKVEYSILGKAEKYYLIGNSLIKNYLE